MILCREHHKKVCCLGLTSLLSLPANQLPVEALGRIFRVTLELLVAYKEQVAGMYPLRFNYIFDFWMLTFIHSLSNRSCKGRWDWRWWWHGWFPVWWWRWRRWHWQRNGSWRRRRGWGRQQSFEPSSSTGEYLWVLNLCWANTWNFLLFYSSICEIFNC